MPTQRSVELRDALADLLAAGEVAPSVRDEIGASWQRCVQLGLAPDHFEVPHAEAVDLDGPLVWAAGPVLDELDEELSAIALGVLLTDGEGHVLDRRTSEASVRDRLDHILLAPGFVYAEDRVGTNAIGTALAGGGPSYVDGREHFADVLTAMTCAAWPIIDPRRNAVAGVIDLSCAAADANPLMLPLVRRAAREIQRRLFDGSPPAERALLARLARIDGAPMASAVVNDRTLLANAAGKRLVDSGDRAVLWDAALRLISGNPAPREVAVRSGVVLVDRVRPVLDGGELRGASIRIAALSSGQAGARRPQAARPAFGWESLTPTEQGVADLVSQGLTNRQAAGQLLMSPYTVDAHLRAIYRKLGVNSRVELTRVAVGHG